MFTGTTIEDLTAMVQRAESHAEKEEPRKLAPWVVQMPAVPRDYVVFAPLHNQRIGAA